MWWANPFKERGGSSSSIRGAGTLGREEEGVAVTFYQGVLFSTSRELWFGRQLWLGARLRPGGLGGGEMKESESFITTIVCLVGILLSVLDTALW